MEKVLFEINRQIEEVEMRLAEYEIAMNTEARKEYRKVIADMKGIRSDIKCKLNSIDNLFKLLARI